MQVELLYGERRRILGLFQQSSVEQQRAAGLWLLLHVEDEVPEVYARYFLPRVLPR